MKWLGLVLFTLGASSVLAGVKWSYDTPENWHQISASCGGRKQSPINIVKKKASSRSSKVKLDNIHRNPSSLLYVNWGNRLGIFFNYRNGGRPILSGGILGNQEYVFLHAELHWGGSEHHFDGNGQAAEWHLIFQKKRYIGAAGDPSDKYAVLAYLCNHEKKDFRERVRPVVNTTQNVRNDGQSWLERHDLFDLSMLLGSRDEHPGRVYAYEGSFTSPDCAENVKWMVAESFLQINDEELKFLKLMNNAAGVPNKSNVRPVQPLNGRLVTKH